MTENLIEQKIRPITQENFYLLIFRTLFIFGMKFIEKLSYGISANAGESSVCGELSQVVTSVDEIEFLYIILVI